MALSAAAQTVTCPASVAPGQTVNCTVGPNPALICVPAGSAAQVAGATAGSCTATAVAAFQVTAPSTPVYGSHIIGGCQVMPLDSVYNTPTVNAPVDPNSANWLAAMHANTDSRLSWLSIQWPDVAASSDPNVAHVLENFYYGGGYNGMSFPQLPPPAYKSEMGAIATNAQDHHSSLVLGDTCQFVTTYKRNPWAQAGQNTASSGDTFASSTYALPVGSTTQAGTYELPSVWTHDDLMFGPANGYPFAGHIGRLTFPRMFGDTSKGVPPAPSGGGVWPGANVNMGNGEVYGVVLRLRSNVANPPVCNIACQNLMDYLRSYGAINDDATAPNIQFNLSSDVWINPVSKTGLQQVASYLTDVFIGGVQQWDFVDLNSLALNSSNVAVPVYSTDPSSVSQTLAVTPSAAVPSSSMVVCPTSLGGPNCVPISLTPITLGYRDEFGTIQIAGGPAWTPKLFVNGTTQTPTYSLTCSPAGGACGTYDQAGLYTPPASVNGELLATLTATIGQLSRSMYLPIVPPPTAKCPLQFDLGNNGAAITDQYGCAWLPDLLNLGQDEGTGKDSDPDWRSAPDGYQYPYPYAIFQTGISGTSFDPRGASYSEGSGQDAQWKLVGLPAGNYDVTFWSGQGYDNSGNLECNRYAGPMSTYVGGAKGAYYVESQGQFWTFWPGLSQPQGFQFACFIPSADTVPMQVANGGTGEFAARVWGWHTAANGGQQSGTNVLGIQVSIDSATPPQLCLTSEPAVQQQSGAYWANFAKMLPLPAQAECGKTYAGRYVVPGETIVLRAQGWWLAGFDQVQSAISWSASSGTLKPGNVNGQLDGSETWTAPATQAVTGPVTISASWTDSSGKTWTATDTLSVIGQAYQVQ